MNQNGPLLSWNKALLAISPGILAASGWLSTDFSGWTLAGLGLLAVFVISGYLGNKRRLPSWSLLALGMLVAAGLALAAGVIGGLTSILAGKAAELVVLLMLWTTLAALWVVAMRDQPVPSVAWVLFTLVLAGQLAVRGKYFVLYGLSWSVAGQWLIISLYSAAISLLLPVVIGQRLARQHGRLVMLFAIGAIYMGFQLLVDVNQKVSGQIGGTIQYTAYKTLIPMLFTVIAPLWFVRAHSSRSQTGGLLMLTGLAVVINLVVVGLAYGDLPLIIWISAIPYTISVLLTLGLADLLYRKSIIIQHDPAELLAAPRI